jgi:hypothetical protein
MAYSYRVSKSETKRFAVEADLPYQVGSFWTTAI